MEDNAAKLKSLVPQKEYFIGFDSDGCVFDTMEIKQKECFCPNTIKCWNLQTISKYARETWEFVNLYSKTRGCSRFLALIRTFELLKKRSEVKARRADIPDLEPLAAWTKEETKLGHPALTKKVEATGNAILKKTLEWSLAINRDIADMVRDIPPFPLVRESLEAASLAADVIVVSSTPYEALDKEWKEHDLAKYVRVIAGQEAGTKKENIRLAAGNKYRSEKILMVGDAPGDLDAARANGICFYPIVPGREDASWEKFHNEVLSRFFAGTYRGKYEDALLAEFDASLPELPWWENTHY